MDPSAGGTFASHLKLTTLTCTELNHIVKLFVQKAEEEVKSLGHVSQLVKSLSPTANDHLAHSFIAVRSGLALHFAEPAH